MTARSVQPAPRAPVRQAPPPQQRVPIEAPPPPVAPVNVVRITPELIESLRASEPLIKGLMDELGAQIIKVEPPENANT
jgi:hypothetical protein